VSSRAAGLIAGLDTRDLTEARRWADAVAPSCRVIKLGLEFFAANGPAWRRSRAGRFFST
jgi:orotidine-5'-phosphate decarboxylase